VCMRVLACVGVGDDMLWVCVCVVVCVGTCMGVAVGDDVLFLCGSGLCIKVSCVCEGVVLCMNGCCM